MANVPDSGSTSGATPQLIMTEGQLETLMSRLAGAFRQPPAPQSPGQQAVALQYRLLRNGLGRFQSASEAFDRALIRIDQFQHDESSIDLVFLDPLPDDASSMVLLINSQRIPRGLPSSGRDGIRYAQIECDPATTVVQLVEFLDQSGVPIAAGVPVKIQRQSDYERAYFDGADNGLSVAEEARRNAPATTRTPKSQQGS